MSTERELVEALTWIDHPSEFRVYWLTDSAGKILAEVGSTSIGGWYAVVGKTRLPHEYTTPGNAKLAAEAASKPSPYAAEVVLPELPGGAVSLMGKCEGRVRC